MSTNTGLSYRVVARSPLYPYFNYVNFNSTDSPSAVEGERVGTEGAAIRQQSPRFSSGNSTIPRAKDKLDFPRGFASYLNGIR